MPAFVRRPGAALVAFTLFLLVSSAIAQNPEGAGGGPDVTAQIQEARVEGNYGKALALAEAELMRVEKDSPGDTNQLAKSLQTVALLREILGLPEEARAQLAEADRQDAVVEQLYAAGNYAGVVATADSQLVVRERWLGGNHILVAWSLNNRAAGQAQTGDPKAAFESYQEAIRIFEAAPQPSRSDLALALNNAADAAVKLGRSEVALDLARRSLGIRRSLFGRVHWDVAMSLNTCAVAAMQLGNLSEAEPLFRESLYVQDELESPPAEAPLLRAWGRQNLAGILRSRGQFKQAINDVQATIDVLRQLLPPDHPNLGLSLGNLGAFQADAELYEEAEPNLIEALEILGLSPTSLTVRSTYSALLLRQGRLDEAEETARQALALVDSQGGESSGAPYLHVRIAQVYQARGDYDAAARELDIAVAEFEAGMTEFRSIPQTLVWRAELFEQAGDRVRAESTLALAADRYERTRNQQGDAGLDRASQVAVYDALAAARLRLGMPWDAWEAAERQLGRVLLDVLRAADRRDITPEELSRESELLEALTLKEQALDALVKAASPDTGRVGAARRDLTRVRAEWSAFRRDLAKRYPVSEGQPLPRREVLESLEEDQAILGWLDWSPTVGDAASWVYVLRPGRDVFWAEVTAGSGTVERVLEAFRRPQRLLGAQDSDSGKRLWEERIAPAEPALDGVQRLVVIAAGRMLGVPVEALPDDRGQVLGDRFEISYVPSATLFTWLSSKANHVASERPALLIGDPPFQDGLVDRIVASASPATRGPAAREDLARAGRDRTPEALRRLPPLPGTRLEVEAIADLMPTSTVLVGADASEQRLAEFVERDDLKDFRILHVATHGLIDDEMPDMSALVLAQAGLPDPLRSIIEGSPIRDGLVTGREMLRTWKLDADLVNLSACETGLGAKLTGEGHVGLAHVLFQVGARSVIVSLWEASDGATALLMARFYENWLGTRDGVAMRKAEALRKAKAWLASLDHDEVSQEMARIRSNRGSSPTLSPPPDARRPFAHPYYWAPFILIGDPD